MRALGIPEALMLCGIVAAGLPPAAAQTYPAKPVRVIAPFPPGGGTDMFARVVGQKLTAALGQQVVVENRTGASGMIGSDVVARAAPDGYTLVVTTASSHSIGPHLTRKPLYDALRDFAPVINIASGPYVLVVHPSLPARTVGEFIALAKASPGAINYASSGNGTLMHLTGELFKRQTGVNMIHIAYRGGPPAVIDLVSGNVSALFVAFPSVSAQVSAGRLRAIAVTTAKRVNAEGAPASVKALPTVSETLPGFEASQWWAMFAPAGTPSSVIDKLNSEVAKIIVEPDVRARFAVEGAEPGGGSAQQFAAFLKADYDNWGKVVKETGIRSE